jgi:hypothetical protein
MSSISSPPKKIVTLPILVTDTVFLASPHGTGKPFKNRLTLENLIRDGAIVPSGYGDVGVFAPPNDILNDFRIVFAVDVTADRIFHWPILLDSTAVLPENLPPGVTGGPSLRLRAQVRARPNDRYHGRLGRLWRVYVQEGDDDLSHAIQDG